MTVVTATEGEGTEPHRVDSQGILAHSNGCGLVHRRLAGGRTGCLDAVSVGP